MNLNTTLHDGTLIITVPEPRIDAAMAIRFKDAIRAATENGPDRVILDMSAVLFVDSSGLGAIVASKKQLGARRKLDLAGLTPDVAKVFRLTRMDSVFDLFENLNDAVDLRAAG
jgi:anti-sigma B factor antagonist